MEFLFFDNFEDGLRLDLDFFLGGLALETKTDLDLIFFFFGLFFTRVDFFLCFNSLKAYLMVSDRFFLVLLYFLIIPDISESEIELMRFQLFNLYASL